MIQIRFVTFDTGAGWREGGVQPPLSEQGEKRGKEGGGSLIKVLNCF